MNKQKEYINDMDKKGMDGWIDNNNNNNGSFYIAHFTMSQCALQSVEDFFGLHITAPTAAKKLTIMRDN
jgi:hypothetical protein